MFACLYSLSVPVAALVKIAEDFTPRFEVVGPLVMLDIGGLSRLFGSPREIGEQLRRAATGPVRIALAPTQTAAALLALGRPGLMVIEPDGQRAALAPLTVSVLGEFERVRVTSTSVPLPRLVAADMPTAVVLQAQGLAPSREMATPALAPPNVGEMEDVLPYFQSSLGRTSEAAAAPHRRVRSDSGVAPAAPLPAVTPVAPLSGGWMHPRDSHAAAQTPPAAPGSLHRGRARRSGLGPYHFPRFSARESAAGCGRDIARDAPPLGDQDLRRAGVAAAGDVYERLGARGVLWQRLARGEDPTPLVPWVPEDPFEASLDLEWPIEGLEPLSFVLGRLLEPLAERLERADRGAAILHTHLRLVSKDGARAHAAVAGADARPQDAAHAGAARSRDQSTFSGHRSSAGAHRADAGAGHAVDAVRTRAAFAGTGLHPARAAHGADGRQPRRLAAAGRFVEAGRV